MRAVFSMAACGLMSLASAAGAKAEAEDFAEQAVAFFRLHCIDPVVAAGEPDPGALALVSESGEMRRFQADEYRQIDIVAGGGEVPPGCDASIFTQPPGTSEAQADARAEAVERRLSGHVLGRLDPGLAEVLRRCRGDRFFRAPHLTAAAISEDGSRITLVTGERRGAHVRVAAIAFGPLSGCGAEGGQ